MKPEENVELAIRRVAGRYSGSGHPDVDLITSILWEVAGEIARILKEKTPEEE